MNKYISLLSVLALSAGLSGCAEDRPTLYHGPWEVRATKHAKIKTLGYKDGEVKLSQNQKNNLRQIIAQAALPGPIYANIYVNNPTIGEENQKRVAELTEYLAGLGIDRQRIEAQPVPLSALRSTEKFGMPTIIVEVEQYQLLEPDCPGWEEPMNFRVPPEGESNFGCTNARNFFHMVAEPRDVYKAQELAGGDGPRNRWPIERLRKDKLKELIQESYAAGGGAGGGTSAVTVNAGAPSGGGTSGD